MPGGGGFCFCACDSDSDSSSVYVKQQGGGGQGRAIDAGLQVTKTASAATSTPTADDDNKDNNNSPANKKLKAKKLSRMRKKSDAAKHDEYIDYSSSTSVERLARDVETVLRSWHVVEGSDRHASMRVRPRDVAVMSSTPKKATPRVTTPASPQPPLLDVSQKSVQLLRSEQLSWQISFYLPNGQHISHSVDLELALWDGDGRNDDEGGEGGGEEHESLPLSLRRVGSQLLDQPGTSTFCVHSAVDNVPSEPQQTCHANKMCTYVGLASEFVNDGQTPAKKEVGFITVQLLGVKNLTQCCIKMTGVRSFLIASSLRLTTSASVMATH